MVSKSFIARLRKRKTKANSSISEITIDAKISKDLELEHGDFIKVTIEKQELKSIVGEE